MNPQPLYVFLDESGNFDFSPTGSKYFIFTALTCKRPFAWEQELNDLRYTLWEGNPSLDLEYFHAAEDMQLVRDQVFNVLSKHLKSFRVDSVIVDKRKTYPTLRSEERFYPRMMGYLLRYVFDGHSTASHPEVKVITDAIPVKSKRKIIAKAVKTTLSAMLTNRQSYSVSHRDSKSCFSLQAVDYFCWAISRKWEREDPRSHKLIRPAIVSEFDIFASGSSHHY